MLVAAWRSFSALQRAEIAEMARHMCLLIAFDEVSVLFNEPKLLKLRRSHNGRLAFEDVSVLFNEPKLLKSGNRPRSRRSGAGFSALQRAEIAEIRPGVSAICRLLCVSVLFNEPKLLKFSVPRATTGTQVEVSVLFNEPKLLKWQ